MSKERARRRAEREREAAIRAAARAAEAERRERRAARRRALSRFGPGRLRRSLGSGGKQTGVLARRRRRQNLVLVGLLVLLNVVVWVVRHDWEARFAALVVSVLVAPVLSTLLFPRRR